MSETAFIVAEIIAGIAILGVLSAVITAIMTRVMAKPPGAAEILDERFARGELTREQYRQMQQDLGLSATAGEDTRRRPVDERNEEGVGGSRPAA